MKPDFLEDLAPVVRSQLKAWMAELKVLSRDPRVRKFAELRQKIETADAWYRLGSPGQGEIGGDQRRLGGLAGQTFPLKKGGLEGLFVPIPPTNGRGETGGGLEGFSSASVGHAGA